MLLHTALRYTAYVMDAFGGINSISDALASVECWEVASVYDANGSFGPDVYMMHFVDLTKLFDEFGE